MNIKEAEKILDNFEKLNPSLLTEKSQRLFQAIMKIADDRDDLINNINKNINLIKDSETETYTKKEVIKLLNGILKS